ncbi:MAG: poly-gamma-glutamate synthase PgsB, partial [Myxococcota bacterium]
VNRIQHRIHVNGTRGKSSVTRLIASALRAGGVRTCAKTTGTTARFILPDGRELPIFRPAGANIIEQKRIVRVAAGYGAEALVVECMALQPLLQSMSELKLIRATHGIITNARPDHLDVMGPDAHGVARALAGTTPVRGRLYTAEVEQLDVFRDAADDRGTELIAVPDLGALLGSDEAAADALGGFAWTEHADNVALALRLTDDLGVPRRMALEGMWKAAPDPGAMRTERLDFFGRRIVFVNAFAANDPVSTEQAWHESLSTHRAQVEKTIAIFNCRSDRADRSVQLGRAYAEWTPADAAVLMGDGTYLFAEAASKAGADPAAFIFLGALSTSRAFERIVGLCGASTLVVGMGNTGGGGLQLSTHFANRAWREALS